MLIRSRFRALSFDIRVCITQEKSSERAKATATTRKSHFRITPEIVFFVFGFCIFHHSMMPPAGGVLPTVLSGSAILGLFPENVLDFPRPGGFAGEGELLKGVVRA